MEGKGAGADGAQRVRLPALLAWCAPGLPVAALGLPLVVYLPPHYAGTLGLPLATVGLLFALVRILDIPLDPLFGTLMDNMRSRFGQFRPWVVAGGLFLVAGVWMLFFASPGVTAAATFLSLFVLYIGLSFVNLAQVSWGSRLSPDYSERARIFGFWTAFNVVGTMAVLFVPPLLEVVQPGASPTEAVHAMGWFVIALVAPCVLAAALIVPEGRAPAPPRRIRLSDLGALLADRRMVRLLSVDLLLAIAPGLTGALFVFFFTAARGLSPAVASGILLFYFLAGLAAAPAWIRLARRWGKHRATALAAAWFGVSLLGVLVVPPEPLWVPAAAMAIAGIPFAAPAFLLRAMMADLVDAQALDRAESGRPETETTGLAYAILTATAKLGYAIPVAFTYPVLGLLGFDPAPGAVNTPDAIRGLELLFIVPGFILSMAAAIIIWSWPITAEAHALIRERLQAAARPAQAASPAEPAAPRSPAPPGEAPAT
jgi:GPH family glycoside/pentoside/hexuronide:cation symporter